jgi:hypothetical protein
MDSARIVEETGSSGGRPRRRRRWLVAAAMATLAAPLASGSAIALSGGSGGSAAAPGTAGSPQPVQQNTFQLRHDGRHPCHRRDRSGRSGSSYRPEL